MTKHSKQIQAISKQTLEKITKQAENFLLLSNEAKTNFLQIAYLELHLSYNEIAKLVGTYPNFIRRSAKKLGIKSRTRQEVQKNTVQTGKRTYIKGVPRSKATKEKIGRGVSETWHNLSDEEKRRRADMSKERWEQMTDKQKDKLQKAAGKAIQKTAKEGSKLEKYLLALLMKHGHKVHFHKEHLIVNEKLHIDMMLPGLNTCIEVDGPSHSRNIWGDAALTKQQKADTQKTALILAKGLVLIRIIQETSLTRKRRDEVGQRLLETVKQIASKFPKRENRYIILH